MKKFDSILIDKDNNLFEIVDGTKGKYELSSIKKISILNEDANFKGKTEPFLHQILGGASFFIVGEPKLFVGLKIITNDDKILAVYISKNAILFNSEKYQKDIKEAKKIAHLLENKQR
ncbi:hypothetical protein WKT02_14005 [Erysipelotrichaceae bacterium HCN-30851]